MSCQSFSAAEAGSFHRVAHEHSDGHGSDAAGNRSEKSGRVNGVWVNVADENAAFLAELFQARQRVFQQARGFRGIGNLICADINDRRAGADPVWLDEAGFAHGGNENVGATNNFGKIARFRMTDGDGSVGVHQQKGHGLADDVTATEHDGVGAFDRDLIAAKNLHAAGGGAGDESGAIGDELAEIHGMEAVNVFVRRDRFENALGIDLRGKWELDEDAVDIVVIIEIGDELKHVVGGSIGGRGMKPVGHAELFARSDFAFDVDVRRGILADKNGGETRANPLRVKAGNVLFELGKNFVADFQTVESLSGHGKRIAYGEVTRDPWLVTRECGTGRKLFMIWPI